MMRKTVLQQNKLEYDLKFLGAEDYYLWWNVAKVSNIATLPEVLLKYRIHGEQITKKKDEQYYEMMNKLMEIRFEDIGFDGAKEEKKMFMKYCLGEYESYTEEGLKTFVDCLNHIRLHNKKNRYFDQKKLMKIFDLAVIYALNNSVLNKNDRRKVYLYAVKEGLFIASMRIKVMYHRLFL